MSYFKESIIRDRPYSFRQVLERENRIIINIFNGMVIILLSKIKFEVARTKDYNKVVFISLTQEESSENPHSDEKKVWSVQKSES